jgi:hypothetical protein
MKHKMETVVKFVYSHMRIICLLLLLVTSTATFAQDPEFPDYRSKKEWFIRINDAPDIRRDLASFVFAGIDESAGKPTLASLPLVDNSFNYIYFEGDGIKIKISTTNFDPSKHKLGYYNNPDNKQKYLVKIDNKAFFGDYGKQPKTQIENISVVIGYDSVMIPKEAYADFIILHLLIQNVV